MGKVTLVGPENDPYKIEYDNDYILGKGAQGVVFYGTYTDKTGKVYEGVAIKKMSSSSIENNRKEIIMNEMVGNSHGHLVYNNKLYIIMKDLGAPLPDTFDVGANPETIVREKKPITQSRVRNYDTFGVTPDEQGEEQFDSSELPDPAFSTVFIDPNAETLPIKKVETFDPGFNSVLIDPDAETPKLEINGPKNTNPEDSKTVPNSVLLAKERTKWEEDSTLVNILSHNSDRVPFDCEKMLTFFIKMANALQKSHDMGILHRDLKPENFMYNNLTGEVDLTDFGIAEFIDPVNNSHLEQYIQDPAQRESFVSEVEFAGSPHCMANELMLKDMPESYSFAQDIYSLGRTFFLLLANNLDYMEKGPTVDDPDATPSHSGIFREGKAFENKDLYDKDVLFMMHTVEFLQMNHIKFQNEGNDPNISALNELLELIYQMCMPFADMRPQVTSEVINRLSIIHSKLADNMKSDASQDAQKQLRLTGKENHPAENAASGQDNNSKYNNNKYKCALTMSFGTNRNLLQANKQDEKKRQNASINEQTSQKPTRNNKTI